MIFELDKKPVTWLIENASKLNIADQFDEQVLQRIGADVVAMYNLDKASRSDWEKKVEDGLKVAKQEIETKSFPWPGCSNTKDPLIAVAAIQYMSRASSELVRGTDVVKTEVIGEDPDEQKTKRGKRVSQYMSWQCLDDMTEWLPDTDQLLTSQSIQGMYYKKTYRDEILKRTCSRAISPMKLVVNEEARDLETAPRATYEIDFYRNEIIEHVRGGVWLDITDSLPKDEEDKLENFLEQQCYYDLDGDGYKEPYVVMVYKEHSKVARIAPNYLAKDIEIGPKKEVLRIKPYDYYTEFPFLPSFDGKFHKTGWAQLLGPMTEEINVLTNQITDAGTLANCPPTFIGKGARLPAGVIRTSPGKMIPVETTGGMLRDNIFIPPFAGPSNVLFQLLGRLDDKASKLAAITDAMTGDMPADNVPATTTLALLEQGLKVLTNVMKRQYRAFKQEFIKIYKLNYYYLTDKEYLKVIDVKPEDLQGLNLDPNDPRALVKHDFDLDSCDIVPVMDPTAASEAIRLAKAGAIHQAAPGNPGALRIYFKAIGVPETDIDKIIPKDPPPDPKMLELQATIAEKQQKGELDTHKVAIEVRKQDLAEFMATAERELKLAQATLAKAQSEKALADSEAAQVTSHINTFRAELDQMRQEFDIQMAKSQQEIDKKEAEDGGSTDSGNGTGGTGGVAAAQGNQEGAGVPEGQAGAVQGGVGDGVLPTPDNGSIGPPESADAGGGTGLRQHPYPTQLPPGE
jgi:chaperonin GroES